MGTGSTGEAAKLFFCHFIGNDKEKKCLDIVEKRLHNYTITE